VPDMSSSCGPPASPEESHRGRAPAVVSAHSLMSIGGPIILTRARLIQPCWIPHTHLLELAGISLIDAAHGRDRANSGRFVVAGHGAATRAFNPEALADLLDAAVIGDGRGSRVDHQTYPPSGSRAD